MIQVPLMNIHNLPPKSFSHFLLGKNLRINEYQRYLFPLKEIFLLCLMPCKVSNESQQHFPANSIYTKILGQLLESCANLKIVAEEYYFSQVALVIKFLIPISLENVFVLETWSQIPIIQINVFAQEIQCQIIVFLVSAYALVTKSLMTVIQHIAYVLMDKCRT